MRLTSVRSGALALLLLAIGACTPGTTTGVAMHPAPRLAEIVDGTMVRIRGSDTTWIEGRAMRLGSASAVVVRANGESVRVTCAEQLQVLDHASDHAVAGALTGLAVGALASVASCHGRQYCGEEDPTPALAAIAGYFIGRELRTRIYADVDRVECGGRGTPPPPSTAFQRGASQI